MYCKFCGKQIDQGTMRCRACGRPVGPLEGGNGFWDLTGEQTAPGAGEDGAVPELRRQVEALRTELASRPAQKKSALGALGVLLALLALAACVYGLQQLQGLSDRLDASAAQIARMDERLAELETTPEPVETPVQKVVFIQQPTDAWPELNRAVEDEYSKNGLWVFTAAFQGSYGPYNWYWEKMTGTPDDPQYVHVSQLEGDLFESYNLTGPDGSRVCRLYTRGPVVREHTGVYVFTVEDYEHNIYRSDPVRLIVMKNGKPMDPDPLATPAPTQEPGGGES